MGKKRGKQERNKLCTRVDERGKGTKSTSLEELIMKIQSRGGVVGTLLPDGRPRESWLREYSC